MTLKRYITSVWTLDPNDDTPIFRGVYKDHCRSKGEFLDAIVRMYGWEFEYGPITEKEIPDE